MGRKAPNAVMGLYKGSKLLIHTYHIHGLASGQNIKQVHTD